jgi:MarR family transcriptional regulator, organic hydroperoxide resistance regulator
MATVERSTTAAREAWGLVWEIFLKDKRRRWAILSELGISPQQSMAIGSLKPGEPMPMSALAEALHCDNSNITGIVDRLEERGLVRRDAAPGDRRVKMLVVTSNGLEVRRRIVRRLSEAPEPIARLSATDQRALREILNRAFEPGL